MQDLFDDHVELVADADIAEATRAIPSGAGVCLFAAEEDKPIILLHGAGLRSIVRNRLILPEGDEKTRRMDLRPITRRLYYRHSYSAFETELAYLRLAEQLYPQRLEEFFPNLAAWFVKVDFGADYPVFSRTSKPEITDDLSWGPFATKKAADYCIEVLEDVFKLCRCPQVLADAPNGQPCSYAQMGLCMAVCDGTVSKEQYREQIQMAVDFMDRGCKGNIAMLQEEMKAFAAERAFEKAQKAKEQIERVKKLSGYAYRWVAPFDRFYVYAFQPGPAIKVQGKRAYQRSVTPFVIGPGWIVQIEPFVAEDVQASCQALIDHYQLGSMQDSQRQGQQKWQLLAWASRFLYGSSAAKGVYIRADQVGCASAMVEQLAEHFEHIDKVAKRAD